MTESDKIAAEGGRIASGAVAAIIALFAPVKALLIIVIVFIGVDFITGVCASYVTARREKKAFEFESEKMWKTVAKLFLAMGGVVLAYLLDRYIVEQGINIAKGFTGFICGAEFISYLENAAIISGHPIFRWIKSHAKKEIKDKTGVDVPHKTDSEGEDER